MLYDELIGELYDICTEINEDDEFEARVRSLNFEVRKNGVDIFNGQEPFDESEGSDVRIQLATILDMLGVLADEVKDRTVKSHLIDIQQELMINGLSAE